MVQARHRVRLTHRTKKQPDPIPCGRTNAAHHGGRGPKEETMRPDTYETVCATLGGFCLVAMIAIAAYAMGWLG
jgi:hypothetical protein